ncbi:Cell division protein FtsX [Clostridiaceae bacterium JG1575]|nr:Cell division protein FtsX [Clostridiaceae bacterium JG1575]
MNNFFMGIGDALKSLKRNFSVTLGSMATMMATMLIFGVFLMVATSINHLVRSVEEQTVVRVFLKEEASPAQRSRLEKSMESQLGVAQITFEDKVTAFQKAQAALGNDSKLLEGYDAHTRNPYPNSYIIRLEKPEYSENFVKSTAKASGVESVANDSDTVNLLIRWANIIRVAGMVIFAVLLVISIFLIANAIKMAVYGRRKEIEIMKFVGATNTFIRWPFIIEGILIGLIGAALAVVLLYFGYRYAYTQATIGLPFVTLPHPEVVLTTYSWTFALGGMAIGAVGSLFSTRKHLNV